MRVSLYGAGQVSSNVATVLTARPGYDVRGPFARSHRREALCSGADIVVIATTSFLREVAPDIRDAIGAGSNVLTTAEECAYPWAVDKAVADELDALAKERDVTVLGAGLNPGFAFDALVLTALGAAWSLESVRVERVVDLSRFGATVLRRIGVGWRAEEFDARVASGDVTGHIGFPQSMRVVADKLDLSLERIERELDPIFADRPFAGAHLAVEVGETAGFEQRYVGIVAGRPWFEAIFTGHLEPSAINKEPRDEIWARGETPVHLVVTPGLDPQIGASAVIANSIRRVIAGPPGWRTVAELPPAVPL